MNDKLSLQDLIDALAQKTQITKKESDLFLRELFQLILERIYDNDQVKIKDFGTFKLTLINTRESVNVNTGEKIEIPSHYRLVFQPDKTLKELINLPFSKYESVILEEGVDPASVVFEERNDLEVQETEIDDISNNIVKKTITDQLNLINEFRQKNTKQAVIDQNLVNEAQPKKDQPKVNLVEDKPVKIVVEKEKKVQTQSFVYTYTSTPQNKTDDVITLTVPKNEFVINDKVEEPLITESNTIDKELLDQEASVIIYEGENLDLSLNNDLGNEDQLNFLDKEDVDISTDNEDLYLNEELQSIESSPEEKSEIVSTELVIDTSTQEEPIVETISSSIISLDDDPLFLEHNSLEAEEIINDTQSNDEHQSIEEKDTILEDDPERPLLPDNEELDTSSNLEDNLFNEPEFVDSDLKEEIISSPIINNKVQSKEVKYMEQPNMDIHDETQDNIFTPDSKPTLADKLKRRWPLVLIILAIVIFAIYSFIKLFDVKYDYERYMNPRNLTSADTLPLVVNENIRKTVRPDILDSDTSKDSLPKSRLTDHEVKGNTTVQKDNDVSQGTSSKADGIILDGTNASVDINDLSKTIKKENKEISKNLNFKIINKAESFVLKNGEFSNSKNNSYSNKNIVTITLESGMTLRSLASKYYGNSIYWVYIYEANRDVLSSPNRLSLNMKLVIPELLKYGIRDTKNQEAIKKAQQLEIKYL